MRRRVLRCEELFSADDHGMIDWAKVDLASLISEPMQRESGSTGVERDGKRWRARPMADGVKHNLGEFASQQEALDAVQEFWRKRLGITEETTQEEVDKKRAEAASAARKSARQKRQEEKRRAAMAQETPLFG